LNLVNLLLCRCSLALKTLNPDQMPYFTTVEVDMERAIAKKLQGDLKGSYSRRINKPYRMVYDVLLNEEGLENNNGISTKGSPMLTRSALVTGSQYRLRFTNCRITFSALARASFRAVVKSDVWGFSVGA